MSAAYTRQIFSISRQGHTRVTQAFGAPTLVWHVGFWPVPDADPQHASGAVAHEDVCARYNDRLAAMTRHLNALIEGLQHRGRAGSGVDDRLVCEPHGTARNGGETHLCAWNKESINFTLWWADGDADAQLAFAKRDRRRPLPTDLRVRVQIEVYPDYATATFFLDVTKRWNDEDGRPGDRRQRLLDAVAAVKEVCEKRIDNGAVKADLLPERDITPEQSAALAKSSDLLYEGAWREFSAAFGIDLERITGDSFAEVFVNTRGLVMSTRGVVAPGSPAPEPASTASAGLDRFHRFVPEESATQNEPNAVVKAFWPFIRRSRSDADHRDWIACGVLGWRAIYISSLGAQSQHDAHGRAADCEFLDEGTRQAAPPDLPPRLVAGPGYVGPTTPENDRPGPSRYLLLTKHEPHRRQVGRLIDRINSLATLQLYALKDWDVLRQASVKVRMYGQELDAVLADWIRRSSVKRGKRGADITREIARQNADLMAFREKNFQLEPQFQTAVSDPSITEAPNPFLRHLRLLDALVDLERGVTNPRITEALRNLHHLCSVLRTQVRQIKSRCDEDLASENQEAERSLIDISRGLDELGQGAVGGIQYRIGRSRYYAETYRELMKTLRCGNIETWWTYEQFASRGVEPAFRFIDGLGQRLERLRERHLGTMESVQTSAIVNQTEATRDNTFQLEVITANMNELLLATRTLREQAEATQLLANRLGIYFGLISTIVAVVGLALPGVLYLMSRAGLL